MTGRTLFLSYSRADAVAAAAVEADLAAAGYDVWRDERLAGGQDWWETILARIRRCDAFVALLSDDAVASLPCARELAYAVRLGRPVLPVRVGDVAPSRLPAALAARQLVDHGEDRASLLRLVRALGELPAAPPLPDPLPAPPMVPLSWATDVATAVFSPDDLPDDTQRRTLGRLREGLSDPAGPADAADARSLLVAFGRRRDLLPTVRADVADLLAGLPAPVVAQPPPAAPPQALPPEAAWPPGRRLRWRHPVAGSLLTAAWLCWLALWLLDGDGSETLGPAFAALALAAAVVGAGEASLIGTHAAWSVTAAGHAVLVVALLTRSASADQTVVARSVATAFAVLLVVTADRAARRGVEDAGCLLALALTLLLVQVGLLVWAAVEAREVYRFSEALRVVTLSAAFAAAGACVWLAVLSRLPGPDRAPAA